MASALTRRRVVQAAAGAAAGLATAARPHASVASADNSRMALVPPRPIPGGIPVSQTQVIHVWAPGPPAVTLPFSGVALQGLDVEPTTIRDFRGSSAVAFHVGTATGGDGTRYDVETDVRAFQGVYVDGSGARRFGTFAFICVDLFVPASGMPARQVHEFNGGILASGLCWTVPVSDDALRVSRDGRRLTLDADGIPVIDSFGFFGANQIRASISLHAEWQATGPFVRRGSGTKVPSTDRTAFRGDIAPARSTGRFHGEEFGFEFHSGVTTTARGHAQIGRSRNGIFLRSN